MHTEADSEADASGARSESANEGGAEPQAGCERSAHPCVGGGGVSVVHACAGEDGKGLTDTGTTEAGAGRVCAGDGRGKARGAGRGKARGAVTGRGGKARGAVESELVVMVPVATEMVTTLSMPHCPLLRCSAAPLLRCSAAPLLFRSASAWRWLQHVEDVEEIVQHRHDGFLKHEARHGNQRNGARDAHDHRGQSAPQKQREDEVQHHAHHQQLVHLEKAQHRRKHVAQRVEQLVDAGSGAQNCADHAVEDRVRIGQLRVERERCQRKHAERPSDSHGKCKDCNALK